MTDPKIIGNRFELGNLLGQGGMATVYLGRDTRSDQTVAIKHLKQEIIAADPDIVGRFAREGEALRRLNHPNIVSVLATVNEDNNHYVVMEYVGGGDLRSYLDRFRYKGESIPVARILEIALDLTDALARAHRLNIVHRDIKPANVLLAEDDTPRLTDFGVAHFGDATRVTQTGQIIGTLAYLSPEGCSGGDLDTRADIWAFGVMLYEMLALKRPFDEENNVSTMYAILVKDHTPVMEIRPDVPAALSDLIDQMLIKDPNQRIGSIRLVGAQLEALLHGKDVPQDVTPTPSSVELERLGVIAEQKITEEVSAFEDDEGASADDPPPSWPNIPPDVDTGEFLPGEKARSRTNYPSPIESSTSNRRREESDSAVRNRTTFLSTIQERSHTPHVYISYRDSDRAAAVGRIYDRLTPVFGKDNVLRDTYVPLEADPREAIHQYMAKCAILLVVIGPDWLGALDENGNSAIEQADDLVRLEIEAGIQNPDVQVIPVMVDRALMPPVMELPSSIHELTYQNVVVVRNDPDFDRDMQWLIGQLQTAVGMTPKRRNRPRGLLVFAALLILALLAGFFLLDSRDADHDEGTATTIAQADAENQSEEQNNSSSADDDIQLVEPVAEDEFMVLLAEIEQVGEQSRGVSRFIEQDLRTVFEETFEYSKIRIRRYDRVIKTDAEAQAAAEANNAALIIWGSFDDESTLVQIQVGSLEPFPKNVFSREDIEQATNVRVRMDDERRQSLAAYVVAAMNTLHTVNNDAFSIGVNLTTLDIASPVDAEIIGNSSAAQWHRYLADFEDPEIGLEHVNEAIRINNFPVYYMGRSLAYQQLGQFDDADEDLRTSYNIAPEGWALPALTRGQIKLLTGEVQEGFDLLSEGLAIDPDNWFGYTLRGAAALLLGDDDQATTDLAIALEADEPFNFTYFLATAAALRQARLQDVQVYFDTVSAFADPTLSETIMETALGFNAENDVFSASAIAFGNFILGRWQEVIDTIDAVSGLENVLPDLYLLQGAAYCNLGDFPAAEDSYTRTIELDPDYIVAYALRAGVRLEQGERIVQEALVIRQSDQAEVFVLLLPFIESGELTCENLFDFDYSRVPEVTLEPLRPRRGGN